MFEVVLLWSSFASVRHETRRGRCERSVCVLDQTFPCERPLSHLGESFSLKLSFVFVALKRDLRWRRGFPREEVERGS